VWRFTSRGQREKHNYGDYDDEGVEFKELKEKEHKIKTE